MNTMAPLFAPLRPDDLNRGAYLRIEDRLRPFFEARVLSSTDVHVAAHLCRRTGQLEPDVALALALVVRAPSRAHICVNLETLQVEGLLDVEDDDDEESQDALASLTLPDNCQEWCQKVKKYSGFGRWPSESRETAICPGRILVVCSSFLALPMSNRRPGACVEPLFIARFDSSGQVARAMDILFRPPNKQVEDGQRLNRQRLAAARSLSTPFSVITGGPGMVRLGSSAISSHFYASSIWTVMDLIACRASL